MSSPFQHQALTGERRQVYVQTWRRNLYLTCAFIPLAVLVYFFGTKYFDDTATIIAIVIGAAILEVAIFIYDLIHHQHFFQLRRLEKDAEAKTNGSNG